MEITKLNETPVRTSRNFNINNIKLENILISENIASFANVKKTGQSEKIKIDENCGPIDLKFGLSEELTNQVRKQANQKVHVNITGAAEKEEKIEFYLDNQNLNLVDDIEIMASENVKATVILMYQSEKDLTCYHNGILRVTAQKNANINIVLLNLLNTNATHFMAIENTLEENAKVQFCVVDFGGKKSVTNLYSNIAGKLSEHRIDEIYLGKENQIFDLNYITELSGEKSKVNMEVQGALKDTAKKHFKGTIDFKKGCKKAKIKIKK